jgi:hypothetical protein
MSEYGKLCKLVAEVREFLEASRSGDKDLVEVEKCEEIISSTLCPRGEKLLSKTNEIDPVTSKPRYGENHVSKVKALASEISLLREPIDELLALTRSQAKQKESPGGDRGKGGSESGIQTDNIFSLNGTFTYNNRLDTTETTLMQAKEGVANTDLDLMKDEKQQLSKLMSSFNKVDRNEFLASLENVKTVLGGQSQEFTSVKGFLKSVITNICAHPEDENLRRIRLSHPSVLTKIVHHDGGLNALIAMGFKVRSEPVAVEWTDEVIHFIDSHVPDPQVQPAVISLANISMLLRTCQMLSLDAFLVMEEPTIENTDAWGAWWDGLIAARALCDDL